jgi:hypothetical protein
MGAVLFDALRDSGVSPAGALAAQTPAQLVDLVAGADFAARLLLLALQIGDPSHAARALSWQAWHASGRGPLAEPKTMPLPATASAVAERADPGPLLARVLRDCHCLERERTPFTTAAALLLHAGVAGVLHDHEAAVALLRQAEQAFLSAEMNAYVAAVRFWLAALLGGDESRELRQRSSDWMGQQRLREPEQMAALHAPGFRH